MVIDILRRIGLIVLFVLVQALVLNRIHLFACATPLLFVYFIILYPSTMPRWAGLILAFILGLSIDAANNTPGLAAFSLTLTAFVQSYLLPLYLDKEDTMSTFYPSIASMGWMKYLSYAFVLTFLFTFTYFTLEAFNFYHWLHWLMSVAGSWLLTFLLIITIDCVKR